MSSFTPHYIYGRHAALEALAANVPITRAYLSEKLLEERGYQRLRGIEERLREKQVPTEKVSNRKLESLAKNASHQGVLLEVAPYDYTAFEKILADCEGASRALIIVLDHIEDEGNVGAIARSAEVVGAAGLVLSNARAAGIGSGAYKTSAGAVAYVPIARVANIAQSIETLKQHGFWVTGATEHAEHTLWEAPLSGRVALVMGSEKKGISSLVQKQCDFLAKLPQVGKIESLNVAQATTVFAYEWLRQSKQ